MEFKEFVNFVSCHQLSPKVHFPWFLASEFRLDFGQNSQSLSFADVYFFADTILDVLESVISIFFYSSRISNLPVFSTTNITADVTSEPHDE